MTHDEYLSLKDLDERASRGETELGEVERFVEEILQVAEERWASDQK